MLSFGLAAYLLCALTSLVCAALLARGYRRSGARLLLWSSICFACFAVNNTLLIVDVQVLPDLDLSVVPTLPSLIGVIVLIYGLVWDSKR